MAATAETNRGAAATDRSNDEQRKDDTHRKREIERIGDVLRLQMGSVADASDIFKLAGDDACGINAAHELRSVLSFGSHFLISEHLHDGLVHVIAGGIPCVQLDADSSPAEHAGVDVLIGAERQPHDGLAIVQRLREAIVSAL